MKSVYLFFAAACNGVGALSWPEEALRANIIAQVSLALNRIWTEWYPSRGYSFNITGSPGYDQAYVNGRTVFAVMERLTAELFNTLSSAAATPNRTSPNTATARP